jgi:hypothetical protein
MKSAILALLAFLASSLTALAAALATGANHSGTLARNGSDAWTFNAAVNDTVIITVAKGSGDTSLFLEVRLEDPNGLTIRRDVTSFGIEITHRAIAPGPYKVTVSNLSVGNGTYWIHQIKAPGDFVVPSGDEGGILINGQNHDGVMAAGDLDVWAFDANAKDTIKLRFSRRSGRLNVQMRLFGPDGAQIANNAPFTTDEIDYRVNVSGKYTVVVSTTSLSLSQSGETTYRIAYLKIPGPFVVAAGDQGGPLVSGKNHDATLEIGDIDAWTFSATEGDFILLRVDRRGGAVGFGPQVALYGPGGSLVTAQTNIAQRLGETGLYTFVVSGGPIEGSYRIQFLRLPGSFSPSAGDEGGILADSANDGILEEYDFDAWTLEASVNETIVFRVSPNSGGTFFWPEIRLYGPDGALIAEDWSGFGVTEVTLHASVGGNYTAVVSNKAGNEPGSYRITALRSRLTNLSIRANVEAGIAPPIVGFTIAGGQNRLLIRGIGPTLATFGVSGVLNDPVLSLFIGDMLAAQNDDWITGNVDEIVPATAQIGAFPLNNPSRDAAWLLPVESRSYTLQLLRKVGDAGLALIEIYAVDPKGGRLVNLSARCQVGTGVNILIAGFVIEGAIAKKLLIRAIGPSLTAFGVTDALRDPTLTVLRGTSTVARNDNWEGSPDIRSASATVGAFGLPADSKDAAVVVKLNPGAYTAQISGIGNTSGVALIEVYELP